MNYWQKCFFSGNLQMKIQSIISITTKMSTFVYVYICLKNSTLNNIIVSNIGISRFNFKLLKIPDIKSIFV